MNRWMILAVLLLFVAVTVDPVLAEPTGLASASPEQAGMDSKVLNRIDKAVETSIDNKLFPGCVVLVARQGKIVWLKAYGHRQVEPVKEMMTTDSVFDVASVTKPVATGTSVMMLVDQGKLNLDQPVASYWPEFGENNKQSITLRHLLTHQSGLSPRYSPDPLNLQVIAAPGEKFVYSCAGCIVAGDMVRRKSGETLPEFTKNRLFRPLGMTSTSFGPINDERLERTVPTSTDKRRYIRGAVNDFQSFELDGAGGNAGVFSTAEDLAIFGQMFLNGGTYNGIRILSPEAVSEMTRPQVLPDGKLRSIGWDVKGDTPNRGERYSQEAFGHGGWTGTSLWIDPAYQLSVVFLSSRHHPVMQGNDNRLAVYRVAGQIGDIAVDSIATFDDIK